MTKETFTRSEAAQILGVKPDTVKKWEKKGLIIPAFHINDRPRYSKEALDKLKKTRSDDC